MGFSFKLPKKIRTMLESGEAWTDQRVQWKTDGKGFDYIVKYFSLCAKDNPAKEMCESQEEYQEWLATTKEFGSITVVKKEYLKNHKIEDITSCQDNEEIGKSSDKNYVYFFSTNDVGKVTELFKKTKVTTTDPVPLPENGCVRIYDGPHKN